MRRQIPIFYNALLLTSVNLLLRFAGTTFQVFLSRRIGPSGIGLLQLVMSTGGLACVAGIAGIRTATMYLTAEEIGQKNEQNIAWILAGCVKYSLVCSITVSLALQIFAPYISVYWIGNAQSTPSLRLIAAFLPATCLCGVMTGYFTAAGRIRVLAAIEVVEQLCSMAITITMLSLWAESSAENACVCVILGSSVSACISLTLFTILHSQEKLPVGKQIPVVKRLLQTAVPLALADDLKSGINTVENLMVPKRLKLNMSTKDPLSSFGVVSGMVFPVMMFPACILFGLAELLVPEISRCLAAGHNKRIRYLVKRGLKVALTYGIFFGGFICILSDFLCIRLYRNTEAGSFLRMYSLLIPVLYCDIITDAVIKGLGQQTYCVKINIFTSSLDVFLLFLLLPKFGMIGYFVSFMLTHFLNFALSIHRLLRLTHVNIPAYTPLFSVSALLLSIRISSASTFPLVRAVSYPVILCCMLFLMGVIKRDDVHWVHGLLHKNNPPEGGL